jgi:hypothetical protein
MMHSTELRGPLSIETLSLSLGVHTEVVTVSSSEIRRRDSCGTVEGQRSPKLIVPSSIKRR